jgi:Protein of unknown function (DUF2933)
MNMWKLRSFLGSGLGLATCLALAAVGAYLLWNHTGHILSAIPYVLLLACPLMHLFGHGHHHHHGSEKPASEPSSRANRA